MDTISFARFGFSLLLVIGLIVGLAWLARRFKLDERLRGPNVAGNRLGVVAALPLDARRKLVIVRRDEREYVLLLGATGEQLIETIEPGANA